MPRFIRILSLLAILALSLAPLAPVAAQCADQAAASEMAAMPDMPCCPDEDAPATPMMCKIGCVQLPAVVGMPVFQTASARPVPYDVIVAVHHADWLVPVDPDPPRLPLRS